MKLKTKRLSAAVRLALSVGAVIAVGASGNAFAQETPPNPNQSQNQTTSSQSGQGQNPTELQTVVVTGTHIRRVDLETASPVVTVDSQAIEASGDLTVGELMSDLPAMTGGHVSPQVNNAGGTGAGTLSLRGLGSQRTLVLVDGHRIVTDDVNAIPANMIERIEVLTTGASATYGSDAIGGVVNFITKKHFKGVQFSVHYGQSAKADGRTKGYSFTLGHSTDKGSIVAGINYNQMDGVLASQRKFSENAVSVSATGPNSFETYVGGSSSSPYGDIGIPETGPVASAFKGCASGRLARNPDASGMDPVNDYHCYQLSGAKSDKYNYASVNLIMTPQERTGGFILGNYDLSDNVSVYLDTFYTKTRSKFQLAPAVYGSPYGASISADNYWNPFEDAKFSSDGNLFMARLEGSGPRSADYSTRVFQANTGIKGNFLLAERRWDWDVGFNYGHISQTYATKGLPNLNKLYTGPSYMGTDGEVHCGTPTSTIDNCDASFNPFNLQSANSVAALQAASVPAISTEYDQQKVMYANASGGVFDLPAGTVQLAVGLNYRKLRSTTNVAPLLTIDPATGTCTLGSQCSAGLAGHYDVKEAYAEVFVPILRDMPGIKSLNVTIGDRYSRFSTFGSTNNKKFAVEWKPIDDLLLRGTVAEVFRAPNISEVFAAPSSDAPSISSDPCTGYTGNPVNPACVNVPADGSFVNTNVASNLQAATTLAGSKYAGFPIKPETGKSFDLGAVYSPSWAPGLSASMDFWHVYLNDIITSVGLQSLLNLCSAGQTVYCQYIHRYPSGPQQGQIGPLTIEPTGNLGSLSIGGVDMSLGYKLDTGTIGRFDFLVNATYLKYYDQQTAPGTSANTTYHNAGHFMPFGSAQAAACPSGTPVCLFPRVRANGTVRWAMGNWSASWKMRFMSSFQMGSKAPSQDVHPAGAVDGVVFKYGARMYHDVSVSYQIPALKSKVSLGVNNVSDKKPPIFYANNSLNSDTDANAFDLLGRYYWARWSVTF